MMRKLREARFITEEYRSDSFQLPAELEDRGQGEGFLVPGWIWPLGRVLVGAGLGFTALCFGVSWGARAYVENTLLPGVERSLERTLNRQIELGDLSYFWPWHLRLGRSEIENLANIHSIDVRVDLGLLIRQRQLGVRVDVNAPHVLWMETIDRGWRDLDLHLQGGGGSPPPIQELDLRIHNGTLTVAPLQGSRQTLDRIQIDTDLDLQALVDADTPSPDSLNAQIRAVLAGRPILASAVGDLGQRTGRLQVRGRQLPLEILPEFAAQLPIEALAGDTDVDLVVTLPSQGSPQIQGHADVKIPQIQIANTPLPIERIEGRVQIQDDVLSTSQLSAQYGQISGVIQGNLDWRGQDSGYQLQADLDETSLQQIQTTLGHDLPIEMAGSLTGEITLAGDLTQPQIAGALRSTTPTQIDRIALSEYQARLALAGRQLILEDLIAQTSGGQVQGTGQIQLRTSPTGQFQLQGSGLDGDAIAQAFGAQSPIAVGSVQAQAQIDISGGSPQLQASWQTRDTPWLTQGQLQWQGSNGITIPQAQITTPQGQASLSAQIGAGLIQAQVQTQDLDLSSLATVLPERISADLSLRAPLQDLGLSTLRAEGNVSLPTGIAGLPGPIQGEAAWDGSGIVIAEATHQGVQAQGRIPIDPQTFQLGALDLNLQAQAVPVHQVNQIVPWIPAVPAVLSAQGVVDLQAHLNGPIQDLQLSGELGVTDLQAAGLSFSPLQGPIAWSMTGETRVDLQGGEDRITVDLGPRYRPERLQLQQGEIFATGQQVGEQIQVQVNDLPLQLLGQSLPGENPAAQTLTGTLGGEFSFDLVTQAAQGRAQVDTLRLAEIEAEQVVVAFDYQQGRLSIPEASLQVFDSRYGLSGDVIWPGSGSASASPQLNLQLSATDGRLQDIISTFQWQRWSDLTERGMRVPLGPATALATVPIETLGLSLPQQLDQFQILTELRAAAEAAEDDPLLPLPPSVSGEFQAQVNITGPLVQPQIGFELEGQNWSAEEFGVDTVAVSGSVVNGDLHLQPLRLQSGERSGVFTGWIGKDRQEGQLQISGLPLQTFERFLPATIDLVGDLNADFTLAGNLQDPQTQGSLSFTEASVNQIPIEAAQAQFTYGQGLLTVDSGLEVESEAITVFGTVPYTLPFAQVEAASPQIDLTLQIPNEGLTLANLFTDQFAWESGESQLNLSVTGTVTEPQLQGSLMLSQGVARFKTLSDPITDITGEVTFDVDSLSVDQITGRLAGGDLQVAGSLPINSRGAFSLGEGYVPLSLAINGVEDLSLSSNLYSGGLSGLLTMEGLLLKPVLGGQLTLSQGTVDLARGRERPALSTTGLDPAPSEDPETDPTSPPDPVAPPVWDLQFDQLDVALGSEIKVVWGQLLDFLASGDFQILGTLQDPRPAGTINIVDGRINLPLAPFRLDKSQPNRAVFDVDYGFDPFLDVHLFTRVTELPLATPQQQQLTAFEERSDLRLLGEQQRVEISATVQGRASEIMASDEGAGIVNLTSTPPRSEEEIFAILGGNAIATLGSSAGVASLAGQEVLNQIQSFTGLDEIRLTPIQQVSTDTPSTSAVSLGLELVKDVGNNLSVSGLINITDEAQPGRYNLRYRLNSQTLLRLTTDLEGNNIASVDFGMRF